MIDFSAHPPLVSAETDGFSSFDAAVIAAACDDVRGACGWHIAPRYTETFHLDADGGTLLTLPSILITEPTAVTLADGTAITDYEWSQMGQLTRAAGWPRGFRSVTVTVDHGFVNPPPALVAVIADMVARASAVTSPSDLIPKTVTHDGATIGYATPAAAGAQANVMAQYGHVLRRFALR